MNSVDFMTVIFGAFSIILTGFSIVLWFLFVEVRKDARKANEDLAAFREHVAREHLTRSDLTELKTDIDKRFDALFDAVDAMRKDLQNASDTFRDKIEAVRADFSREHQARARSG